MSEFKKLSKTNLLNKLINEKISVLFGESENSSPRIKGRLNYGNIEKSNKNISLGGKGYFILVDDDKRKIHLLLKNIKVDDIDLYNKVIKLNPKYITNNQR